MWKVKYHFLLTRIPVKNWPAKSCITVKSHLSVINKLREKGDRNQKWKQKGLAQCTMRNQHHMDMCDIERKWFEQLNTQTRKKRPRLELKLSKNNCLLFKLPRQCEVSDILPSMFTSVCGSTHLWKHHSKAVCLEGSVSLLTHNRVTVGCPLLLVRHYLSTRDSASFLSRLLLAFQYLSFGCFLWSLSFGLGPWCRPSSHGGNKDWVEGGWRY